MCGRYSLDATPQEVVEAFALADAIAFPRRYNIAPGQSAPVIRAGEEGERRLTLVHWGLPRSAGGRPLINARSETAATRPSFRSSFRRRRCVVPATGFYEWQKLGGAKQPFHIRPRGGGLLGLAGLWDRFEGDDGAPTEAFVILTTQPNRDVSGIHDRMPAILAPEACSAWLDPSAEPQALSGLLEPPPDERLAALPVSSRVNSPEHDDAACAEPLARAARDGDTQTGLFDEG